MKIDVNTAGLMMDCMSYAFVAAVTKERGTAPSDEEIHHAVKSLMTLYCRHEGISAPIDEVPSEYTMKSNCPYSSPDEDEDEDEDWDEAEDENEDEDEEEASYSDFRDALENLLHEYNLHTDVDVIDYFMDGLE